MQKHCCRAYRVQNVLLQINFNGTQTQWQRWSLDWKEMSTLCTFSSKWTGCHCSIVVQGLYNTLNKAIDGLGAVHPPLQICRYGISEIRDEERTMYEVLYRRIAALKRHSIKRWTLYFHLFRLVSICFVLFPSVSIELFRFDLFRFCFVSHFTGTPCIKVTSQANHIFQTHMFVDWISFNIELRQE